MARSGLREPTVPEAGHTAYRRLREGIASGQFHPNERLVEGSVATRLGVGRTAVRAALVRLDQEGLVTLEVNRGARVRLISDREALGIEEVRAPLEAMLARRAATRARRDARAGRQEGRDRLLGAERAVPPADLGGGGPSDDEPSSRRPEVAEHPVPVPDDHATRPYGKVAPRARSDLQRP